MSARSSRGAGASAGGADSPWAARSSCAPPPCLACWLGPAILSGPLPSRRSVRPVHPVSFVRRRRPICPPAGHPRLRPARRVRGRRTRRPRQVASRVPAAPAQATRSLRQARSRLLSASAGRRVPRRGPRRTRRRRGGPDVAGQRAGGGRRRRGTWCCSAILSSWPSRATPRTRQGRAPPRSSTSAPDGPGERLGA